MNLLATILFATVPHEVAVVDAVDCIESNTVYNCEGEKTFTQIIFWRWSGSRHDVVAWRMDRDMTFSQRPPRLIWRDGNYLRQVRADYWRETHTQWDIELQERAIRNEAFRQGLQGEKR